MPFVRVRNINGRPYTYLETRYRENGKVKSRSEYLGPHGGGRSSGPVGGGGRGGPTPGAEDMRKAADELYRNVLRENVELFGKSHPGARAARTAAARDAYQRYLQTEQAGKPTLPLTEQERHEQNVQAFGGKERAPPADLREALNNIGRPSPEAKAEAEYMANRATVQAEDAKLDAEAMETAFDKGSPTDDEEAMHVQWSENQAADRDDMEEDYTSSQNAADAQSEEQAPEASESQGQDNQADEPDV